MKTKYTFLFAILLITFSARSQLTVNNGHTAQELADILAGENITATNVSVSGDNLQYGSFTFTGDGLDVNSGVILSTGNIFDAIGPNSSGSTSTSFGGPGNALLTDLANSQTYDAVVLQFDFEVQSDKIEFNFNFLSEEYNEWVGSSFNDVFAFFISGPGITGEENLAVVPGTTSPVSINTINNDQFWQFYHDNENGNTNVEFDGYTTLLTAVKEGLISCETYTLKLMTADAGDGIYDAGVLLQENSLVQENISAISNTYSGNNIALEGCIEASFTFELEEASDRDIEIYFSVEGSAVNGVDYDYIDPMIIIPEGQTSATIIINSILDGISEGQESIELIFTPHPCEESDTVYLFIDDFQPIEFTALESPLSCNGFNDGEVLFNISGGFSPYIVNLTDTLTGEQNSYTANPIVNIPAGTYSVEIIDSYGCGAEDVVFGDIFNAGTTFLPTGTGVTYETSIDISGFSPGETMETIDQLHQISAVMEHSYANDLSITLRAPNGSEVTLKIEGDGYIGSNPNNSCDMGEPVASGRIDEWNASNITPGIGYEYVWNLNPTYNTMSYLVDNQLLPEHTYVSTFGNELTDYYYPAGSYTPEENFNEFIGTELNGEWTIIVTDFYILDNGYIFEWGISLSSPQSDSIITISEPSLPIITETLLNPDCGLSNGAIDISVNGDQNPYTFLWNTGAATQNIDNISSGSYSVEITGEDNCNYDFEFNLSDNGTLVLNADITHETCVDADNGSIDLTVTGGTEPFNFNWTNGATTEDISNLAPADYTVTANDDGNCSAIETYIVEEAVPIIITANITNENCGDQEGIIDLTISGGLEPYSFIWNTGETTEDIDELSQGTYTVTVTDGNGCTTEAGFSITNYVGNCIPDCDLAITNELLTDENCGQGNGAIDLTIFTSFSPYEVSWSNGSTTDDIDNLSANNYTITITDAEGCELISTYTINNDAGNLAIISTVTTDETCGNGQGAIDITVNGGALPYIFDWSNGATTEDINNINEGSYSVIVTDANGCSVSSSADILNDAGTLELVWGNAMNETCGNSQGSVDILIAGGNPFGGSGNEYYQYLWSNGDASEDLINIGADSYSCTITDEDGCQITTPVYIVENESGDLAFDLIDIDHETCGNGQGEIELFVSGGTGSYTYLWSTGSTEYGIFNVSAGTYSAVVSDDNGCSIETGNLEIINNSGTLELAGITTVNELCNNEQGAIYVTLTGGTLPYNSLWNTGSTSEDLLNISAGNYSCIVTDDNGCEISFNTTINNEQGTLEVLNTVVTDETCGNGDGAVDLIMNGGTTPYNYNWSNGAITEDLSNLSVGTYTCIITDIQGCQADASAYVDNNTGTLNIDNYILTNEQCGAGNGSIDLVVSGTETPFIFAWDNGATTEDISNLTAGTYTCIITDAIGCTITGGPYIINNTSSTMSVDVAVTDETCGNADGSIDLTIFGGTAPFTFNWNTGATTEDISGLSAGIYSYTVTDDAACSLSGDIELINNSGDLEISTFTTSDEICSNGTGTIDITVSGGSQPYDYIWNTGASSEDLTNLSAGIYNVVITDDNGCQIESSDYTISNNPGDFTTGSIIVTDEICSNGDGAIDVNLSGGDNPISYLWNTGDVTQDLSGLSQGIYNCTAIDANGCELDYFAIVENSAGDLSVDNTNVTDATCGEENGAVDITVSGGNIPYDYAWSTGETTEDLINIGSGTYTCIITDNIGCFVNTNATVNDTGGDFDVTIINITDENCDNGEGAIDVHVTGGTQPYSFLWSNGETTEDISNLSEGTYSLTVNDDFGCILNTSAYVSNIPSTISIDNAIITNEFCNNGQGAIDISVSGGNTPFSYLWSNGETSEDISDLTEGNYSVTITDINGCELFQEFVIVNIITLDISSIAVNEICGQSNGSIDITVNASSGTVSFLWNTGETTEDLTDLAAGIYTCDVSDEAGCSETVYHELINETGTMEVTATLQDDMCGEGGSVELEITGTPSGYTVLWSNGSTEPDIYNLEGGTYSVEVTNTADGCVFYDSYVIETIGDYSVTAMIVNSSCSTCPDGAIGLSLDPVDNYTFNWSNGETTEDISGLLPGDYTVIISNDLACEFEETYTVNHEVSVNSIEEMFIYVYPNPTYGILKIEYEAVKDKTLIRIVNVIGVLMFEEIITNKDGMIEINISNYAAGIYYLSAGNNKIIKTIKIIKQNH